MATDISSNSVFSNTSILEINSFCKLTVFDPIHQHGTQTSCTCGLPEVGITGPKSREIKTAVIRKMLTIHGVPKTMHNHTSVPRQ
jgi:hypothetical protein